VDKGHFFLWGLDIFSKRWRDSSIFSPCCNASAVSLFPGSFEAVLFLPNHLDVRPTSPSRWVSVSLAIWKSSLFNGLKGIALSAFLPRLMPLEIFVLFPPSLWQRCELLFFSNVCPGRFGTLPFPVPIRFFPPFFPSFTGNQSLCSLPAIVMRFQALFLFFLPPPLRHRAKFFPFIFARNPDLPCLGMDANSFFPSLYERRPSWPDLPVLEMVFPLLEIDPFLPPSPLGAQGGLDFFGSPCRLFFPP